MLSRLLLLLCTLSLADAHAALYRCEDQGRVTYTDRNCGAGVAPYAPQAVLTVLPAGPSRDLAREYDARIARGFDARQRSDAAFIKAHAERTTRENEVRSARVQGRVAKGMSAADVVSVLGEPDRRSEDGQSERWTWAGERTGTVTLRGGVVVAAHIETGGTVRKKRR